MKFLKSKKALKFYVVGIYALVGALVKAEILPKEVSQFVAENAVELLFMSFGLGHVAPELLK